MNWKYLNKYVKLFNSPEPEEGRYLPRLIIYFRKALDKIGLSDADVPDMFGWDEETAEDFYTWGHNSRWAHTFNYMLADNVDEYVDILKSAMEEAGLKDFEVILPEE